MKVLLVSPWKLFDQSHVDINDVAVFECRRRLECRGTRRG